MDEAKEKGCGDMGGELIVCRQSDNGNNAVEGRRVFITENVIFGAGAGWWGWRRNMLITRV